MPRIPPVGNRFKKGNKANPLGANAHSPERRAMRRLTQIEIEEIGTLILEGDINKLQQMAQDPTVSALRMMIASVVVKAIQKGDHAAMETILARMVGRVKQTIDLDVKSEVKALSDEELLSQVKQITHEPN